MNPRDPDVLVIGGNPGGCSAAVSAARSGLKVLLLEPTAVLGGMNANGTFGFDCAAPQALSGIAEEVAARIRRHYERAGLKDPLFEKRADLVWESHVAAKVWRELVDETLGLEVHTRAVPVDVRTAGGRIAEVWWQRAVDLMGNIEGDEPRQCVRARIVIDASYEGDVAAWSGVPFRLGREARSALEPHAGKIFFSNQKGSPEQGYLPHSILPGSTGEADDAIMAFAYRLHCRIYDDKSPDAAHRLRAPPAGYDPSMFEWEPVATDARGEPLFFNTLYVLVNGKFLVNRMVRGNNLVGPNRDYVLAHPRDRKNLRQQFIDRALSFLYFIQNEGGMPELGLADDEFQDNANLPYQMYVREGRRIEGAQTLTEADVSPYITGDGLRPPHKHDAVAIGDWAYESQGCADDAPQGYPYPDGYIIGRATRTPYQIPYDCLIPQGVNNLIVCGCISATHIAFGATRVEATRIQLGIAAGIAAGLGLSMGVAPADVPVSRLQQEIVERGGKLVYFADVESTHHDFQAIQWAALRGFVPADADWCFHPDDAIHWADLVDAVVVTLGIPFSVTGVHFEGITRSEPCYRSLETLFDLGSRAGVDLFGLIALADEDPMKEFLRLYPKSKLLPFRPGRKVLAADAIRLFQGIVACIRPDVPSPALHQGIDVPAGDLSRAAACRLLRMCWDTLSPDFNGAGSS